MRNIKALSLFQIKTEPADDYDYTACRRCLEYEQQLRDAHEKMEAMDLELKVS